jgi:hypothetical protein
MQTIDSGRAEQIAIRGLAFIAGDPELLRRFLAITGIEAGNIRASAKEPGFLAGVLQFILAHEPTAKRFAEEAGIDPPAIMAASRALPLGDDRHDRSI